MKTKKLRLMAAGLSAAMLTMCFTGCANEKKADNTLTVFSTLGATLSAAGGSSFNDCLTFQLLEEKTGIHVDWQHPPTGGAAEKFNTMIVSGEYPDIIQYNWSGVSGGIQSYVDDEVIVDLTEYIYPTDGSETSMPNFVKLLEEHPEFKKDVVTDEGRIYTIPYIRLDQELNVYQGVRIRQDWLDKLNLDVPKTTEDLYQVLKAFKTQDPNGNGQADEIPMSAVGFSTDGMGVACLFWAFGTTPDFQLQDGKVVYGPLTEEYKESLAYIAKLYSEGLIDKDYLTDNRSKMDAKWTSDQTGFGFGYQPSTYYASMNDGTKKVEGIGYFTHNGGENYCFNNAYVQSVKQNASLAVTAACADVKLALSWVDELFGGDGLMYANYGKEGLSYELKDGVPTFTEYMTNNPDGKTLDHMAGLTCAVRDNAFPMVQTWQYYKQILQPWGIEAIENWLADDPYTDDILPALSHTAEENETVTSVMNTVTTYMQEESNKVITGRSTLEDWDKAVAQMKSMGIEDVVKIKNDAYARYQAR